MSDKSYIDYVTRTIFDSVSYSEETSSTRVEGGKTEGNLSLMSQDAQGLFRNKGKTEMEDEETESEGDVMVGPEERPGP